MLDAYIYDGLRSPIGRHAGKLAPLRPDDLAAEVIREVVSRNKVDAAEISDVVLGCVNQAGEDSRNVARFAALLSGLPPTTPGRHRQPPVRERPAGRGRRRARGDLRRRRPLHRRRRREHEPRALRDVEVRLALTAAT